MNLNPFSCPITIRERFQLVWQLVWPTTAVDVGTSFLLHVVLGIHKEGAELISEIPNLLLVAPWLVRRMMRREHPGFRLKTLVDGAPVAMDYTQSFKVMWLLNWRTSIVILAMLPVVSYFLRFLDVQLSTLAPTAQEAPFLNALGFAVVMNAAAFLLMPVVMAGMFRKHYQGFRVAAERVSAEPPKSAAVASKKSPKRKK